MSAWWRATLPVVVTIGLAVASPPGGLQQHAWWFFAIFAGVIVGLVLEPLPGGAIGLIGVTLVTALADHVLLSPAQVEAAGAKWPAEAIRWALSGFSNTTVWLIFGAFMFALGYEKTGLGRRIALWLVRALGRTTLALGYAVAAADLVLAPFTPSNTARSAGTVYPVIMSLAPLYDSRPHHASARRVGGYLMWTAIAATCVTSSMFLTGLAPNLLALELARKTVGIDISWVQWYVAFAPVGALLLLSVPLLTYVLYRPEVTSSDVVSTWAAEELSRMGPITARELTLAVLVVLALLMWVFGGSRIDPTGTALAVIALMLLCRVVTWDDVVSNKAAWNTLAWFGTLVALAGGLSQVGFVAWFATQVAGHMTGLSPTTTMVLLVTTFFFAHYMFASITAHATALLPVMLTVGSSVPGLPMRQFTLLMVLSLGIMGILTPYATGPAPIYYGSGYIPTAHYWRLGAIFGVIFLVTLLVIGVPWTATAPRS